MNEYFPVTNVYSYDEGPFKMQERWMDFNITEFLEYAIIVSYSALQLSF